MVFVYLSKKCANEALLDSGLGPKDSFASRLWLEIRHFLKSF